MSPESVSACCGMTKPNRISKNTNAIAVHFAIQAGVELGASRMAIPPRKCSRSAGVSGAKDSVKLSRRCGGPV